MPWMRFARVGDSDLGLRREWRVEARGEPMAAGNIADRHARLQRLIDDRELLLRREPPPAGNTGNDFHLRKRLGHRRMPRTMPSSERWPASCSIKHVNRASSEPGAGQ